MPLGWIDFSRSERNKVMNVIHLLNADNQGAVDELGIGVIRDAFCDFFFLRHYIFESFRIIVRNLTNLRNLRKS